MSVKTLDLRISDTNPHLKSEMWGTRRYYDFNARTTEKRIEKLRYMHRNPVQRGLVAKPEEWKWSSFLHYATGVEGTVEIESEWTASRRGGKLPAGFETKKLED